MNSRRTCVLQVIGVLAFGLPALPPAAWGQAAPPATSSAPAAASSPASGPATAPATRPGGAGCITVRAVQGTAGGPKLAGDAVIVELFQAGGEMRKIDTRLNDRGLAVVDGLSLAAPCQPRVTVLHAGSAYEAVGKVLDAAQPQQEIPVTVYESAEKAPAWTVKMRHVMVSPSPTGLAVMEVLAVSNPADRAWLGPADAEGNRASIVLDLPADANGFRFDGAMDDCCTKVTAGRAVSAMPLKPGMSQIRMAYIVPITGGQAKFDIVAPAPVENLMLFVPSDGHVMSQAPGLMPAGAHEVHGKSMQCYQAAGLAAGARTSVAIGGLGAGHPGDGVGESSLGGAYAVVLIGLGAMMVCLALVFLARRRGRPASGGKADGKA